MKLLNGMMLFCCVMIVIWAIMNLYMAFYSLRGMVRVQFRMIAPFLIPLVLGMFGTVLFTFLLFTV